MPVHVGIDMHASIPRWRPPMRWPGARQPQRAGSADMVGSLASRMGRLMPHRTGRSALAGCTCARLRDPDLWSTQDTGSVRPA